jgi:hypothetical protein
MVIRAVGDDEIMMMGIIWPITQAVRGETVDEYSGFTHELSLLAFLHLSSSRSQQFASPEEAEYAPAAADDEVAPEDDLPDSFSFFSFSAIAKRTAEKS